MRTRRNHPKKLEELLKAGSDPNQPGWDKNGEMTTALIIAIRKGNQRLINLLLDHGADANLAASVRVVTVDTCAEGSERGAGEPVDQPCE